jgi:hypothetical protein
VIVPVANSLHPDGVRGVGEVPIALAPVANATAMRPASIQRAAAIAAARSRPSERRRRSRSKAETVSQ